MKIKQLILSGYKRLLLNNIHFLRFTPESVYQLILGTNGSGKSSVLYELSPLPANSSDFAKDGYKKISIEHGGNEYELESVFKSGNKHSFLKNGEELNPGRTGTVQKDLVQQEFGIDKEHHQLLTGKFHFTDLSPAKRREWVTRLCSVDFTYAINTFKQFKSKARDAQGALKHVRQRITSETGKLQTIGDLTEVEVEYKQLHEELELLFTEKDNSIEGYEVLKGRAQEKMEELETISAKIIKNTPSMPPGEAFNSVEDLEGRLDELKISIQVKDATRSRIATEREDIADLLSRFEGSGEEDGVSIKQRHDELLKKRDEELKKAKHWKSLKGNPEDAHQAFYEIVNSLLETLKNLPANPNRYFNRDEYKNVKERVLSLRQSSEREQNRLSQAETKLEHLLSLKEQKCPKCNHRWIPGLSDDEKKRLEKTIEEHKDNNEKLQKDLTKAEEYVEKADEYSLYRGKLRELINQYPKLVDLWDEISGSSDLDENPGKLAEKVTAFQRDIEFHLNVSSLNKEIEKLSTILDKGQGVEQVGEIKKKIQSLDDQLEQATAEISTLNKKKEQLVKLVDLVKRYLKVANHFEETLGEIGELVNQTIKSYRNTVLSKVILTNQDRLAQVQSKRSEKHSLEGVIDDLQKSEKDLEIENEALSLIADELSPTDGLIAEQLTGFIENMVNHVNQIIESIWNHELIVIPCGVESGDLDYKFPITVRREGKENLSPDISEGSEAQVEVINLAFRLVVMAYLNLDNYPVYLDEIGHSFDEQHRVNVMSFIKSLVDTGNYTQLFLISHYASQFGAFTQAEVMVLDETNISVPQQYNKHVVLG